MKFLSIQILSMMFAFCACSTNEAQADSPITTSAPSQPTEMPAPVTAQQWNKDVVGWNLGDQFDCSAPGQEDESMAIGMPANSINAETAWGNPVVTKKLIKAVKNAGFNAVRIPIRWQCHITNANAMTIDKAWTDRIREVVDWCLAEDMKVIINVHHEKWLESQPYYSKKEENCQKFALLWMNIATAFADYDYRLAFAGTNEVHVPNNWGAPTAENLAVQNAYNQTFIDIVRSLGGNNEKRHLIVQTYVCNPDFGINNGDFIVPKDIDGNGNNYMSVEFHYYTPYDYCGNCKYYYWGQQYKQYGSIPEQDENSISGFFDKAVSTWASQGLGIVIGEWGVTDHYKAGEEERCRENITYYCHFYVTEAKKRGFSTFIWDNNAFGKNGPECFGIFDRKKSSCPVVATWVTKGIFQ